MTAFTTAAIYKEGVFIPRVKFPYSEGEVFLTVIPKLGIADGLEAAVRETFGSMPDLPDGVTYTNEIRKEWDERLTRIARNVSPGQ